jgi:hypothetical protein
MSLGSAIYSILRTNANIVSTFGTRIYPIVVPQNASANIPAITYQQTGMNPNDTKDKYNTTWNVRSLQVTVYAHTFDKIETYCEYVETALIRYKGTVSGEIFHTIDLVDESFDFNSDFTIQGDSEGIGVFLGIMNFNVVTK